MVLKLNQFNSTILKPKSKEDLFMSESNHNMRHDDHTNQFNNSQPASESTFTADDINTNKTIAGLAYFIFFLPLLASPDSKYGRFHANQALLLFIAGIAGNIMLGLIPIIGWALTPLYGLVILVLGIMGLLAGFGGKAKQLPIIGGISIIK